MAASVYFVRDVGLTPGGRPDHIAATIRSVPAARTAATQVEAAISALLDGPDADEARIGMTSAVNPRTRLLGVEVTGGEAVIDLSHHFEQGGTARGDRMAIAQMVFTATAIEGVTRVTFAIDGSAVEVLGDHALPATDLTRDDMGDVRPAILVETPAPFAAVGSPLRVSGEANTFEAVLGYRLTDRQGRVLAEGTTTASAGTGSWGAFTFRIRFEIASEQRGTLTLFETSAADGTEINVVELPVRLVP